MSAPSTPLWIYNPLPEALGHYQAELMDVLAAAQVTARPAPAGSVEVGGTGLGGKVSAATRDLAGRLGASRLPGRVLACWPTFGLLDPVLWAAGHGIGRCIGRTGSRIAVIVHDPAPLRRQSGMGRWATALGRVAARSPNLEIVVHSRPASQELVRRGWRPPIELPHPILATTPGVARQLLAPGRSAVTVLGQYKPARNLDLLTSLGPALERAGLRPSISGRGWPTISGWSVQDRFLSEAEFDDQIRASAAIVIPYSYFFQSGVAVRAVELGVPVVGPRHPFLADLLGADWPGLVDTDAPAESWRDAAVAAVAATTDLAPRAASYRDRCEAQWAEFAQS